MSRPIVTRFAPSPTGFLHIGGARTALFNWYFAKKMAILKGMDWLGLSADDEIIYQSRNADAHVAAANTLLQSGAAYRCYATAEEVDALKAEAREKNRAFRSPYRDSADTKDAPFAVRFRVPDGQTEIKDHVQGSVSWQNDNFDDPMLFAEMIISSMQAAKRNFTKRWAGMFQLGHMSRLFTALTGRSCPNVTAHLVSTLMKN